MASAVARLPGTVTPQKEKFNWRNIPKARRAALLHRPQFYSVSGKSKLQLKKPLTKKARRIITTNKTANRMEKSIKKREQIGQALSRELESKSDAVAAPDRLAREQIRRQRNPVGTRLEDRKRHLRPGCEEPPSSDDEAGSDSFDLPSSKDDMRTTIPNLDGAFDDHIRAQPMKRKVADGPGDLTLEKRKRKRAKQVKKKSRVVAEEVGKEQPAKNKHLTGTRASAPASESHFAQPSTITPDNVSVLTGDIAAIGSMSEFKKPNAVGVNDVGVNDVGTAVQGNGHMTNDSEVDGNNVNGGNTTNGATTDSSKAGGEPTVKIPWYKRHALDMMNADFNDHVYDGTRRRLKKRNPEKEKRRFMRGALLPLDHGYLLPDLESDRVKMGDKSDKSFDRSNETVSGALPSPPTSSTASSSDTAKRVDKSRKDPRSVVLKHKKKAERSSHGKGKSQTRGFTLANSEQEVGKARSMPRSPVSDP